MLVSPFLLAVVLYLILVHWTLEWVLCMISFWHEQSSVVYLFLVLFCFCFYFLIMWCFDHVIVSHMTLYHVMTNHVIKSESLWLTFTTFYFYSNDDSLWLTDTALLKSCDLLWLVFDHGLHCFREYYIPLPTFIISIAQPYSFIYFCR